MWWLLSWVCKKCSGIKDSLIPNLMLRLIWPIRKSGLVMTSLKYSQNSITSVTCSLLGKLQAGCGPMLHVYMGQVLPPTPSSHQPPSASVDPKMGVFNKCEEWVVAGIRDMGHNRNIEPPKTFHWTCYINMKGHVSFDSHLTKLFNQYNDMILLTWKTWAT